MASEVSLKTHTRTEARTCALTHARAYTHKERERERHTDRQRQNTSVCRSAGLGKVNIFYVTLVKRQNQQGVINRGRYELTKDNFVYLSICQKKP